MLTFSFYVKKKKKKFFINQDWKRQKSSERPGGWGSVPWVCQAACFGHGVVSVGGSEEPLMVPAFISSPAHVTAQRVFS